MADDTHQPTEEEVALMLKRAGLTVPPEQLETCCAVVARLEAAAGRLWQLSEELTGGRSPPWQGGGAPA